MGSILFILCLMNRLISLHLPFAKMVGLLTTKNRSQWSDCWNGEDILHWFLCFGIEMRLLYPIIWHGDIVVGSLFFHKVYANCDSELSLHCHIQYIVVSRIAPEPQCKFSFLVYACFRHLVKRLPEVTTIRWPRKKEQLLLWRGRSFGTKPAKHDKNEEKKRKIGLWGILVFLSLVTSKSKKQKKALW